MCVCVCLADCLSVRQTVLNDRRWITDGLLPGIVLVLSLDLDGGSRNGHTRTVGYETRTLSVFRSLDTDSAYHVGVFLCTFLTRLLDGYSPLSVIWEYACPMASFAILLDLISLVYVFPVIIVGN